MTWCPPRPDPRNAQEGVVHSLHKIFLEGHFDIIWLLLDASEQKRHILGGTYALGLRTQDSRALCYWCRFYKTLPNVARG